MYSMMSKRAVFSMRPLTILADLMLDFATIFAVMMGVLMTFEALMISLIRGTPKVTSGSKKGKRRKRRRRKKKNK